MSLLISLVMVALAQSGTAPGTATVSGQVLEEDTGAPIQGVQVTVFRVPSTARGDGFRGGLVARPLTATTDRDGRFLIDGLEPNHYRLSAQKAGYAPSQESVSSAVDLGSGEHRSVAFTLQRGAVLVGIVLDESGAPLTDARVMALRKPAARTDVPAPLRDVLAPAGPMVQTNDLGEFRLFSLPAGEYFVQATPRPDFGNASASQDRTLLPTFFPDAADPTGAVPVTLAAGQTSDQLVIRMASAAAFRVSGAVVDEAGAPVGNALVKLIREPDEARLIRVIGMDRGNEARTDAAGRFNLTNVIAGSYSLVAVPPLILSSPGDRGPTGSSTWMSFGGTASGTASDRIVTESSNGTTVEYRDDRGTRVSLTVADASPAPVRVVVKRPR